MQRRAVRVERRVERRAPPAARRPAPTPTRQRAPRARPRVVPQRVRAQHGLRAGGCRPPSAPAPRSGRAASHHSSAIHAGWECLSAALAGVRSSSAATSRQRLARGAAQHGVRRGRRRAGSRPSRARRVSPTAAWAARRSRNSSWYRPRRSAARTRRVELGRRPAGELADHVVERRLALDGTEGELGRERAVAAVELAPARLALQRPVRPGALSTAQQHLERAARGRAVAWRAVEGPSASRRPCRRARVRRGGVARAASPRRPCAARRAAGPRAARGAAGAAEQQAPVRRRARPRPAGGASGAAARRPDAEALAVRQLDPRRRRAAAARARALELDRRPRGSSGGRRRSIFSAYVTPSSDCSSNAGRSSSACDQQLAAELAPGAPRATRSRRRAGSARAPAARPARSPAPRSAA